MITFSELNLYTFTFVDSSQRIIKSVELKMLFVKVTTFYKSFSFV